MKKAEEKPAVEMTVGGKPKSGASHPPWKSLRDSHIPTARRLLYIFKTFARKEPSSAIASGYGFRLILRLEKTASQCNGSAGGGPFSNGNYIRSYGLWRENGDSLAGQSATAR